MTIQPGESRTGHHQARDTQELMDAANRIGERQEQRYSRDPSTDEFPAQGEGQHDNDQQAMAQEADLRPTRGEADEQPLGHSADRTTDRADRTTDRADRTADGADRTVDRDDRTVDEADRPVDRADWTEDGAVDRTADGTEDGTADRTVASADQPSADQPVAQPVDQQVEQPAGQQVEQWNAPTGAQTNAHGGVRDSEEEHVALFDSTEADELRNRWREVQTAFVDDPKQAVQGADQLVAQVIQSLTASFAAHKKELDGQWQRSDTDGPATEDLRLALRRYRTLFNQLLNT